MIKQSGISDELIEKVHNYLLALGKLTLDFSEVERAPRYPDGDRETDVEHSFHLALSAMELAPLLHPELDIGLVAQFSLVHDLPEIYSGDVWTFSASDEDLVNKKVAEDAATERLMKELPPYTAQLLKRYEQQVEPEARFVRFVDKLLPAIINMLNEDANSFKADYEVSSYDELLSKREKHLERLQEMFPEFTHFEKLLIYVWEASARSIFEK